MADEERAQPQLTETQAALLARLVEMAREANPAHPERVTFEAVPAPGGKATVRVKDRGLLA